MAYVIAQPCIGEKDSACVEVCPVDCIQADEDSLQMYINPAECIDCGACEPECPVEAIFQDHELPADWKHFEALNAAYYADK